MSDESLFDESVEVSAQERDALSSSPTILKVPATARETGSRQYPKKTGENAVEISLEWDERVGIVGQEVRAAGENDYGFEAKRIMASNALVVEGGENAGRKFFDNLDMYLVPFKMSKEEAQAAKALANGDGQDVRVKYPTLRVQTQQNGRRLGQFFVLVGEGDALTDRKVFPGWTAQLREHFTNQKSVGKTFKVRVRVKRTMVAGNVTYESKPEVVAYAKG